MTRLIPPGGCGQSRGLLQVSGQSACLPAEQEGPAETEPEQKKQKQQQQSHPEPEQKKQQEQQKQP
ncbi:hypothetical protein V8V88_28250 [Paenibacillus phytohabitans]